MKNIYICGDSFNSTDFEYLVDKSSVYDFPRVVELVDHLGGFDTTFHCRILDHIASIDDKQRDIITFYIPNERTKSNYPNFNFLLSSKQLDLIGSFDDYKNHPMIDFKNLICSFNGSPHVSRNLLTSALHKHGLFNEQYCSKNFTYSKDQLYGNISDYTTNPDFFDKILTTPSDEFCKKIINFVYTDSNRYNMQFNISTLEHRLTESFMHIVSETMATNYHPYLTEKPFFSIVTRGLFLAWAQPNWHSHFENMLGFKKYTTLFDYSFDSIVNPIERLVKLLDTVYKFKILSFNDLHDLYLMELDNINFNIDHYFSKAYIPLLEKQIEIR